MKNTVWSFLLIFITIAGCKPSDNSTEFWDNIPTSPFYKPFVFVLTSSKLPTAAEYGQPKLERLLNDKIAGIPANSINAVMMHGSSSDSYYSNIAEELKFLFDQNGNGTLNTIPAYFSDLVCYNIDSNSWYNGIRSDMQKTARVALGVYTELDGNDLRVYVKGTYNASVSDHNLAVYLYKKTEDGIQTTSDGQKPYVIKNRVYGALTPTMGTAIGFKNSGDEFRENFTYQGNMSLSQLGILCVVYETVNDVPVGVINSFVADDF